MRWTGQIIKLTDVVFLLNDNGPPHIAQVIDLFEANEGDKMLTCLWFYRPEDVDHTKKFPHHPKEIFLSGHTDTNYLVSLLGKCHVYGERITMPADPQIEYLCNRKFIVNSRPPRFQRLRNGELRDDDYVEVIDSFTSKVLMKNRRLHGVGVNVDRASTSSDAAPKKSDRRAKRTRQTNGSSRPDKIATLERQSPSETLNSKLPADNSIVSGAPDVAADSSTTTMKIIEAEKTSSDLLDDARIADIKSRHATGRENMLSENLGRTRKEYYRSLLDAAF